MIKNLSLLLISFLIFHAVAAQINQHQRVKRFGVRAGVNISHMNFAKGVPPSDKKTTQGAGLSFGFVMLLPVSDRFSFQPEYLYSQTGGKIQNSDTSYRLNYISLPLFLKCQLNEKIFLLAGPRFDILINAKKTVAGNAFNITHDTEERSIGAVAGIEYQFKKSFSLTARYMHGFNHIGIGQRSDIQEFKFEILQVTSCFKF